MPISLLCPPLSAWDWAALAFAGVDIALILTLSVILALLCRGHGGAGR